ncbi:MAG: ABC transporter substrate-binding protein [Pseudomonadota bacterium]
MRADRRQILQGLLGASALAAGLSPAVGRAQRGEDDSYRIFMITWRGWEDGSQGFEDYLTRRDIPVELIIRDAARDRANIEAFVQEAKELQPDLVYTWGTTTALTTFGRWDQVDPELHITEIPGVFNIVSTPVESGLIRGYDEPRPNLTGTLYLVPVETQLRTIESYGNLGRIGMVFNELESNSRLTVERVQLVATEQGIETIATPVPLLANGTPDASAIPDLVADLADQQADWLYIPPDSFLNVNRDSLTGIATELGLPSFAGAENFIRDARGLVGLVSRYYNVGQYAAYLAERILTGSATPGEIPVRNLERFSLLVNRQTAQSLSFYPPLSMLSLAEFV